MSTLQRITALKQNELTEIIAELFDDDLQTTDTETSIELNFAVLKFNHTIKKKKSEKNLHFRRYHHRPQPTRHPSPMIRHPSLVTGKRRYDA
jgi:hypothetical protein